jgi:hypothetical protein
MSAPTVKDLIGMQELTRMTGQLNNVQLHQVKMWVHGILCADSAVIEFDPDEHVFSVEVSQLDTKTLAAEPDLTAIQNFKIRTEHFNSYMKVLLGEEYGVVIKMKDRVLANFVPTQAPRRANQDWKRIFTGDKKNDNSSGRKA